MSGPWDEFQQANPSAPPPVAPEDGPWAEFSAQPPVAAAPSFTDEEKGKIVAFAKRARTGKELTDFVERLGADRSLTIGNADAVIKFRNGGGEVSSTFLDPDTPRTEEAQDPSLLDYGKMFIHALGNDLAGIPEGIGGLADAATRAVGYTFARGAHAAGLPDWVVNDLDNPITIGGAVRSVTPEPQTAAERYSRAVTQGLGAVATGQGAGAYLSRAASPVARGVGTVLQSSPGLQATGAATAGLASQGAADMGAGPTTQLLVGLGAGAAVVAAPRSGVPRPLGETPTAPPPIPRGPIATIARLTGADRTVGARLVAQRLHDDGINPYDAGRVITEAQANGTPLALADLGENVRALGSSVSRQPGPARTIAKGFTKERQMGQMDRVRDAINRDLGPTTDVLEESARLIGEAKTNAAPVYREALEGGSLAPLEHQFESTFRASSGEVAAARRAVASAQRRATQAAAETSRAGNNVYGASGGLRAQRAAADELQAAQSRLTAAEAAHQSNLERLRQAQADGSANAPGAIWSPRIQQFLDDPITKAGLAKGLEVQRLEALAEGKPFSTTEYAITGTDAEGNPIVSSVPNMRTLDAIKRGFDEVLNSYPRGPSGKLILDQRGRAIDLSRKAFLREVDRINPTYADARAQYAGPAQLKDAMMDGKAALNKSASEINQRIKNMTPAEADQFGLGLRSAIADAMEGSPDGANKVRALIGNPKRRAVLQRVFGGKANLDRFVITMENEQAAFETHHAIHGNSATQPRAAEDQANSDLNLVRGVGSDLAAVGGGHVGIGLRAIERGADLLRFGAGKAGQRAREDASSLLFSTSPSEFESALGKITLKPRRYPNRWERPFPITSGAVAAGQYGKQEP